MGKLRRTHVKPLSAVAVSTTIASVWDPPAGKRVRVMGVSNIHETAGTALTVAVTDGTAAASGTLGFFSVLASGVADDVDFGDAGLYASLDAEVGIKSLAGAGTISCTLVGREEGW
ncbi:hypothetical protein LCGC14_0623040 [marine sediment metagenome]|uniref:Uncharacterized protein n=1 Tax=marine sediment metagenome TaxID=412755 RepID=A0A0F9RNL2_9ZZZZ